VDEDGRVRAAPTGSRWSRPPSRTRPASSATRARSDRPGPTFTADTLAEIRAEEPDAELFFVLGEDAAVALPEWERIEDAFALATFVVVTRPGSEPPDEAVLPGPIVHLEIPQLRVSSTDLRERFARGGATRWLVPPSVDAEVRRRGLYGAPPPA
jgi:nicotinate-nucleotide adenylyltransferase